MRGHRLNRHCDLGVPAGGDVRQADPEGRTRTVSFAGLPDQLRIPVFDDQLWLIGEDQTTLHSLDATSGEETGAPIALPAASCDNVAAGLSAVWVACHDVGLVRVDPVSRDVTRNACLGQAGSTSPSIGTC